MDWMSGKEGSGKDKFPTRKIVETSLSIKASISCGIIAFAKDTGRWLVVKRRYSVAFSVLAKGAFRKGDLPSIVKELNELEVGYTRILIDDGDDPIDLLTQLMPTLGEEERNYTIERLRNNATIIKNLLDGLQSFKMSEWIFPKGKTKDLRETYIECARREFNEEAGFEAKGQIISQHLTDEYIGFSGRPYRTYWWICQLDKEVKLVQPMGDYEIVERRWISADESDQYLSDRIGGIFLQAIDLLNA